VRTPGLRIPFAGIAGVVRIGAWTGWNLGRICPRQFTACLRWGANGSNYVQTMSQFKK